MRKLNKTYKVINAKKYEKSIFLVAQLVVLVMTAVVLPVLPARGYSSVRAHSEGQLSIRPVQSWSLPVAVTRQNNATSPQDPPESAAPLKVQHRATVIEPFSAVALTWPSGEFSTQNQVSIRVQATDAAWGPWSDLATEQTPHNGSTSRSGTELWWTGPATGVEVQAEFSPQGQSHDAKNGPGIQLELIDPGHQPTDSSAATVPKRAPASDPGSPNATTLTVTSRKSWGVDESKATWRPEYAQRAEAIAIHHTATSNNYQPADVPGIVRAIFQYHAVTLGWGDIGYNMLVDKFGRAWEGRVGGLDKAVVAAHILGFNYGTSGVSLIGDYTQVEPTQEALETIAQFIAYKLDISQVDPKSSVDFTGGPNEKFATKTTVKIPRVVPHKELGRTACPGNYLENKLDWLRSRSNALLGQVSVASS